jgi:hypothetical protein
MPRAVNGMKECSKCHEVKPVGEFWKCSKVKDGLASKCKQCYKAYCEANEDKIKDYNKAYRKANKHKIEAYRKANKEKAKATHKAWHEANKEKAKATHKAWYEANKDKRKAYREANKEKRAEWAKARYESFPDKIVAGIIRQQLDLYIADLPTSAIPPELIELKRKVILANRKIKSVCS